ncbi:MAG: FecR domain-containing protein [Alphaproteobacteria bacterium]|nr:FecR domain-containing protein [Alphaproteobacteria bacterium]
MVLTGADGSIGVTFTDSTMFSVGPNTEIVVDKYVFDPNANNVSFTANIAKGTLQFISGKIAKLSPDAVKINIPTGTIAVRSTRFLVEVGRPSP